MYDAIYLVDLAGLLGFIKEANRRNYEIIGFTESVDGYTVIYKTCKTL